MKSFGNLVINHKKQTRRSIQENQNILLLRDVLRGRNMQVFQNCFYGSSQIIDFLNSLFAAEFFSFLPSSLFPFSLFFLFFLFFLSFLSSTFFCFSFNISLGELCKNSKYGNLVCDIEMNLSLSACRSSVHMKHTRTEQKAWQRITSLFG